MLGIGPVSKGSLSVRGTENETTSLPERLDLMEAEIIRETLSNCGGNVQETIAALGIPRKTFYDKLQRHGIVRRNFVSES